MVQQMTDNFWQAEARSEETKKLIKDIKRLTRRKFTAEEKCMSPATLRQIGLQEYPTL